MEHDEVQFMQLLMRPGTKLELRAVRIGGKAVGSAFVTSTREVDEFSMKYGRDAEIYMGVAPRSGVRKYAAPTVLWVDVDFKLVPEKTVRADLLLMDPEPSVVINSGGGLHLYWILDGKMPESGVVPALKWLARQVGGDMSGAEVARVLRVPGTMNHKYTPPRQVTVESIRPELRYEPWEFAGNKVEDDIITSSPSYSGPTAGEAAHALARARVAEWPVAIEGDHGDDKTYELACMLVRDLGIDEEDTFDLMSEWNERCLPPWSDADLRKKIHSAMRYGKGTVGADDPSLDFVEVAGVAGAGVGDDLPAGDLEKLNAEFRAVDDGGELRIFSRVRDEALDRFVWRRYRRLSFLEVCNSVRQLKLHNMGSMDKPKMVPLGEYWLDYWRGKKTFNGMTMRPDCDSETTQDNMLNMWHGFSVVEKKGNWDRLKELTREVLCRGDEASYEYVMNWLARAIQIPWEPGKTALVFRGRKGAGKSTLGNIFARLFGQHGLHITGREQFIGRFNSHLRDCVALFADEAFWAGDKQGESQLKAFITESSLTFEQKGKDPEMGRNYLHVIMASNMDWVIPASVDERRFAVFEVANEVHDADWWAPLHDNMEIRHGILPAMLWELRRRNISKFDVFNVPLTAALAEQKMQTLDPIGEWLLRASEGGWSDFGTPVHGMWPVEDVFSSYSNAMDGTNVRSRTNPTAIGVAIRKFMPGHKLEKKQIMMKGQRRYFYFLPDAEKTNIFIKKMLGIYEEDETS